MRIDKYLKVSRIVKRRTVAKGVCEAGNVTVNGRPAKPGTEVKPGDRVRIQMDRRALEIEVIAVSERASAAEARQLYRVLSHEVRTADPDTGLFPGENKDDP